MSDTATNQETQWSEDDSAHFIDTGRYYVPERELQIQTICDLVPPADGECHIVELCSGEGLLSRALLAAFPESRLHAFDGSERMLASTRETTGAHADRLETHIFDLAATDWRTFPWSVQAVVSSLAVHHLDGDQKRVLYADMAQALAPGGALIIADLIEPQSELSRTVAAKAWDAEVERRALEIDGHRGALERFQADQWNLYSDPEPDPIDKPSAVFEHLSWLAEAGLEAVEVYWMKAGHMIYGGRKPAD